MKVGWGVMAGTREEDDRERVEKEQIWNRKRSIKGLPNPRRREATNRFDRSESSLTSRAMESHHQPSDPSHH